MEFAEVLLAGLDRLSAGGEEALEALIASYPEHAQRLRHEISRLRRLGLVGEAPPAGIRSVPDQLGGFRLIEILGEGGMGLVWLAEEIELGRRVALKMVRPEQLCFPGARERFRREVETVARLQHPGIVPVHAVGEDGGVPFFTMEPIDGCTLADALSFLRGSDPARLSGRDLARAIDGCSRPSEHSASTRSVLFESNWIDACVAITREIAEALDYAHGRGLVHRDVKPSNIALTRSGRAMLLDFGLTQSSTAERVTRSGSHPGSIPYMSPEQIAGARDLDARTDVYSLGVTFYELLTLEPAFRGAPAEVLLRIKSGEHQGPRARNRAIPREVETVCSIAMSPERERRYPSAGELARDLGHVLARRPIEARPASALLRLRRWTQRHPAWAVGVALGFVLVVLGPSSLYFQQVRANREISGKNVELAAALSAAESASERAQRNAERAESNAAEARSERDRAEANLKSAFSAVDRMLARVGDGRLDTLPAIDSVRYELLADALEFYAVLDRQRPDAAFKSPEAVRTRLAMVKVLDRMGLAEQAEALERDQIHDLHAAHLAAPDDPSPTRILAVATNEHALRLVRNGRIARAAELLEEADALIDQAVCARGGDPYTDADAWNIKQARGEFLFNNGDPGAALQRYAELDAEGFERFSHGGMPNAILPHLAQAIGNHAYMLNHFREGAPALEAAHRALAVCAAIHVGEWDRTRTETELAAAMQAALANDFLGRMEEDIRWQRRSLDLSRMLADHHPEAPEFRELVATNACNLGIRLGRSDREDEALPLFESSVGEFAVLVAAQPNVVRFQYAYATALTALESYHVRHGEIGLAVSEGESALEQALGAWRSAPKNPEYALNVGRCERHLCMSLSAKGDHRRMAEVLHDEPDRMRASGHLYPAGTYREMAGHLARAASSLPATAPADREDALAAVCRARAIRCLEVAIERGFKDRADLENSPDLEPLRASAEFWALVDRLP